MSDALSNRAYFAILRMCLIVLTIMLLGSTSRFHFGSEVDQVAFNRSLRLFGNLARHLIDNSAPDQHRIAFKFGPPSAWPPLCRSFENFSSFFGLGCQPRQYATFPPRFACICLPLSIISNFSNARTAFLIASVPIPVPMLPWWPLGHILHRFDAGTIAATREASAPHLVANLPRMGCHCWRSCRICHL